VGLKGTDGVLDEARRLGATPIAADRAARALVRLELCRNELTVLAAPDAMGADLALAQGFDTVVLRSGGTDSVTSAADTRAAAAELVRLGVDLILFAGGDGTARDIHEIVGDRAPVLGIPTGVKMHSAVFATSPEHAGDVAASFVCAGAGGAVRDAEVVDVDEEA